MKIIILGAGQVGTSLAENLAGENHDVTVVDIDHERLQSLQERFDLNIVHGRCSYPDVLRDAGADEADLLIAVTNSDESNMVACQVAYSLFHIPTKIARIRSQHYFIRKELFGKEKLPIDVFINPEGLVTHAMHQLISHPGALQVIDFSDGLVKLVVIKPHYSGVLLGKTIQQMREHLGNIETKVVAIYRNNQSIAVNDVTEIEIGDEVFFIADAKHVHDIMIALRHVEEPYKKIIIGGGGNIGYQLAKTLEKDFHVKIIEQSRERCEFLAKQLNKATVLCGDSTDRELLLNENIDHTDVYCAMTNDDEDNIISSLQAKKLGAKQVMTLIARTAYVDLIEGGAINIAISPQLTTVSSILRYMRRGDMLNVYSMRRGAAEAVEIVAHGDERTSQVIGKTVDQIKLPADTRVGGIVRNNQLLIDLQDVRIESLDHVILFLSNRKDIRSVEKLFQVNPGFFA